MYYIKKIVKGIFNIYIITTISFFLISLIPGKPETVILGVDASQDRINAFRKAFNLDLPVFKRYIIWLKKIAVGDFGVSLKSQIPVKDLVLEKLPLTILITIISVIIIFLISIPLAFMLNKIKNKGKMKKYNKLLALSISIPSFWLAILVIYVFSILLKLGGLSYDDNIFSLIIPCCIIAVPKIGQITYNLKKNLYHETRQEYIKYLYSNGMNMKYLNLYVLKNAILPVLPLIGLMVIDILTGVVIIEQIFSIPGIGRLLLISVYTRDIPLLQALIIYTSSAVVVINIVVDILYGVLDKRISMEDKKWKR